MRFYEHEAKRLLAKHGVPIAPNGVARTAAQAEKLAAELGCPVRLNPQILFGLDASAAAEARDPAQARTEADRLLGSPVHGRRPECLLIERKVDPSRELSLRITYDGSEKRPVLLATDSVGRDIDDVADEHPERVRRRHFSALLPPSDYRAKELCRDLGLSGSELNRTTRVIARSAELFLRYDLTVLDLDPLVTTESHEVVAVGCRADMEVEGRARQKAILRELGIADDDRRSPREPTAFDIEGAEIDSEDPRGVAGPIVEFDGNIGLVIGAGGGSLTYFDAVRKHGGRPANYAAIGGNPSVRKAMRLTQLILRKPGVEKIAVMSNVVSNTRADLVARGVIKGVVGLGLDPAETIAIFRVPGAWEQDAFEILDKYGIEYCDRTVSMSEAARRAVEKIGSEGS